MTGKIKKTITAIFAFSAILSQQITAQTSLPYINNYDAGIVSSTELNGTARFMGVGGAMGALGGDASSLFYNPAGIGVYRSSEITVSVNGNWDNTSMINNTVTQSDFNLQNISYIGSWSFNRDKGLVGFNVGIAFNRMKNFNRSGTYTASENHSISQMTGAIAYGQNSEYLNSDNLDNTEIGWLPILGYESGAIWQKDGTSNEYVPLYDLTGATAANTNVWFRESGYMNEFSLTFGGNISNMFYWGMSFICNVLDYNMYQTYKEKFKGETVPQGNHASEIYGENRFSLTGTGFTYKIGAIVKPVSWLRIGAAFHTPTYYAVNSNTSGYMSAYASVDGIYAESGAESYSYRSYLASPLKAMGSLGFVIGKYAFIGLDYQYENFKGMSIKDNAHVENLIMNNAVSNGNVDRHTIRLGIEGKPIDALALRLGGGYSTPINTESAERTYFNNDIRTDLSFYNIRCSYNVTAGIGYYVGRHAFDLAYVWQVNNADYYYFADSQTYPVEGLSVEPVKLRSVRNQFVFTYSIRF